MSSSIKLKNLENTEFTVQHNNGSQAITVSSEELSKVKTIDTIAAPLYGTWKAFGAISA